MSNVPATTHAKRQQVADRTRAEIMDRSQHRCELGTFDGGRCSGFGRDVHHVKMRSSGGGHEIDNLAYVCGPHHQAIHRQRKPWLNGPLHDEHGRYYSEDVGDSETVAKRKWYVWPEIAEHFAEQEARIHGELTEIAATIDHCRYAAAALVAQVDRMGLYELRGYDSAIEYVMGEAGSSESSARHALRVGHALLDRPDILKQLQERRLYFSAFREALGSLNKLAPERIGPVIDEMADLQDGGVPVEGIVEVARAAAGHIPHGKTWQVTATFKALSGALTLEVRASDAEGARQAFKRRTGVVGLLEGVVEVERFKKTQEVGE